MPLAFPYPLYIGTDICSVSRIAALITRPTRTGFAGHKFAQRLMNRSELQENAARLSYLYELEVRAAPGPEAAAEKGRKAVNAKMYEDKTWKLAEFLAGRWAAKEAAIKAHPFRQLTFHDITITHEPSIKPRPESLRTPENGTRYKEAPVALVRAENGKDEDATEARVSISHDGAYATAVCMAAEIANKVCMKASLYENGVREIHRPLGVTDTQPLAAKYDPSTPANSGSDDATTAHDASTLGAIDVSKNSVAAH